MAKEIRFSSVIDTAAFDKSIKEMQDKLKSVYQGSDSARNQFDLKNRVYQAGAGPAPTAADRRRVDQEEQKNRLETKNFIREQMRAQEQLGKELNKQIEMRKELLKLNKETLEVDNKISEMRKSMANNERAIGEGVGYLNSTGPKPLMQRIGGAKGLAAAAGVGVQGIDTYNRVGRAAGDIINSQGSVMQNFGRTASDILTGNGISAALYSGENAQAMKMAREERERADGSKYSRLALKTLGLGLGGLAFGGAPGGLAGAAAGLTTGEGNLPDILSGAYSAQLDSKQASRSAQLFQSLKDRDPVKQAMEQRYNSEKQSRLSTQRMLGLDDSELGTLIRKGTDDKFGNLETMGAMSEIIGAGGSTMGARSQANFVNDLKKRMDLTNAGSMLGSLDGASRNTDEGKNALIKILAEGTRLGFDSSGAAEEQRKFVAAATSIVISSGAMGEQNKGKVVEGFANYVVGNKGFQIQAAQSVQSRFNEMSGQGGGFRGAIKAAALNRDEKLKDLSVDDRNYVLNLTETELNSGGIVLEGIASRAGLSLKEFQSRVKGIQDNSFLRTEKGESIKKRMQNLSDSGKKGTPEFKDLQSQLATGIYGTDGGKKMSDPEIEAMTASFLTGYAKRDSYGQSIKKNDAKLLGFNAPDRITDRENEANATADAAANNTLKLFVKDLDKASNGISAYSEKIVKLTAEMSVIQEKFGSNSEQFIVASKSLTALFLKLTGGSPEGEALSTSAPTKGAPKK